MAGQEPNTIEKFYIVLGQTFNNFEVIIGELNANGKTQINAAMVDALKKFILSKDKKYLITAFINNSYAYWEQIKTRNEKFLIENIGVIFGEYSERPEFADIKKILVSETDADTKICIWDCLTSLVRQCITYVFEERGAIAHKSSSGDGKMITKLVYKNKEAYENVELAKYIKMWNLKLY